MRDPPREVLGFPKKMGQFKFTVTVPSRASSSHSSETETFEVSDNRSFNATDLPELGATVSAEVWRGGTKLLSISGRLDTRKRAAAGIEAAAAAATATAMHQVVDAEETDTERTTIFPSSRNVIINVQTTHPLPPNDPERPDAMCLGNRPRLLQFLFDEIPTDNVWRLAEPTVSINQTKTDAIGVPFGKTDAFNTLGSGARAWPRNRLGNTDAAMKLDGDGGGWPLEVVDASFGKQGSTICDARRVLGLL